MAEYDHVQTSFIAGEITPRVRGRLDFENFFRGADELLNFIVLPHGSISRRPGTRFVAEVKDSSAFTRLIPFTFSSDETYIIEAGDQYFRFYTNEGQIVDDDGGSITITNVNLGTDTFTITGDWTGVLVARDVVVVDASTGNDGLYIVESVSLSGSDTKVTVTTDIPDGTADGTMFIPLEVATPYTTADLPFIRYTQSADILFLVHPDYAPRELQRTSSVDWSLVEFTHNQGPYMDVNGETTTLALSGTSGSVTVTASSTTGINDDQGFLSTDVGRLIRFKDPAGDWSALIITAITDTTHVTASVIGTLESGAPSAGTATTEWRLGAWSDTTGWPHTTTFHQERLWFGATDDEAQTLWSSNAGDFSQFAPTDTDGTVADNRSITATAASNAVNAITWMFSTTQGLLLGTSDSEAALKGTSVNATATPDSHAIVFQTNIGSDNTTTPAQIGHSILYVQRGSKVVNRTEYSLDNDGYKSVDVSILAEHLLRPGVGDMVYQQNPDKILWMENFDGKLLGLSIEQNQEVLAWHQHELGGTLDGLFPVVDDVQTIQNGDDDQIWLVVERDIDGGPRRYIEFIETQFDSETQTLEDAYYVDAGLTGTSVTATTTWTGLEHLEGEAVSVLADGAAHPDVVVTNGTITLTRTANTVQVGLGYTSRVRTVPIEVGGNGETSIGKLKRATNAFIRFVDTVGARAKQEGSSYEDIIPFGPGPMNQPPDLFNGTKKITLSGRRDYDLQVTVEQTQPLPMTIVNIAIEMEFD